MVLVLPLPLPLLKTGAGAGARIMDARDSGARGPSETRAPSQQPATSTGSPGSPAQTLRARCQGLIRHQPTPTEQSPAETKITGQ